MLNAPIKIFFVFFPGFKTEEIIAHCKWYSKYVYLRERQQMAIDKWKTNKRLIKKSTSKVAITSLNFVVIFKKIVNLCDK